MFWELIVGTRRRSFTCVNGVLLVLTCIVSEGIKALAASGVDWDSVTDTVGLN